MASIHEVAKYLIENGENITPKKLQKLSYYSEAWSNALLGKPLVSDTHFEAWVHGPVSPELYRTYRQYGWMEIDEPARDIEINLDKEQIEVINSVLETYGHLSGNELEAITHREDPWLNQRKGLEEIESGNKVISTNDMAQYYRSIYVGD